MNKISKKIVSLVTAAAFATTLVPAAAFAAPVVNNDSVTIEQTAAETISVKFNKNASDVQINLTQDGKPVDKDLTDNKGQNADSYADTNENAGDATANVTDYHISLDAGDYTIGVTADNGKTTLAPDTNIYVAGPTDAEDSSLLTYDDTTAVKAVTVDQGEPATIEFDVKDDNNHETTLPLNGTGESVVVWATQGGTIVNNVTFDKVDATDAETVTRDTKNTNIWIVTGNGASSAVVDGDQIAATFTASGTYEIHAAVVAGYLKAATTESAAFADLTKLQKLQTVKVTVNAPAVVTNYVTIDGATSTDNVNWYKDLGDNVTPSDTKMYTVSGIAYESASKQAPNTTLTLQCDENGDGIHLQSTTVKTDAKGAFSFKFTLTETAWYEINVINEEGKVIGTVIIDQDDVNAASIDKISDGGIMLAGNDVNYSSQVYGNVSANNPVYFGDAVKLSITDVYGVEAEGGLVLKGEAAADKDATHPYKHSDNLRVVDKPEATDTTAASTLTADDLELAWDPTAGVYTLAYVGDNAAKDLVPGDYAVRVALNQGGDEAVTVYFTLAKFGTAESIDFNITAAPGDADTYNDDAIKAIDDKVALGQYVTVEPVYVDENGLRVVIPTKNYSAAVTGKAVAENNTKNGNFWFTTRSNTISNEALIGSEVTVQVMDKKLGYQTKTLTIVSAYLNETLAFDSEQGPVDKTNTVNVTVVDENGDLVKVNGTLSAYVADQSNEDATVDVDVNKSVKNGAGKIYVESNAEGTADIVVAVKATNGEMYANTLHYTFGDEDEYAGRYVVMTIGSSDYLINNEIVKGDAAPYVDDAWRTMVPFRVLGEAFGAEVDWNQEAQSVTYTVGDTEIVMTIGENTYTLNGEEQTMDTAPVLSGDRTYVPVRFVAEDLGFEVTPLYDVENGATASVVFQK